MYTFIFIYILIITLISTPSNITELATRAPSPITAPEPITTLGPI